MARPPKSVLTIKGHRTKKEIAYRSAGEAGTLTGEVMRERGDVKDNPDAHKEFMRLRKLFRKIEKDDAIYSQVINDYCLLHAESLQIAAHRKMVENDIEYLEEKKADMEPMEYIQVKLGLYDKLLKLDADLDRKRDKKRAIEDKNLMNIQSALRSIPKKPEEKANPLLEALNG